MRAEWKVCTRIRPKPWFLLLNYGHSPSLSGPQIGPNFLPNSTSTTFRRSESQDSCFSSTSMLEGRSIVKIVFRVVQIVPDNQHGAEAARVGCSRQVPCCFP